MPQLRDVRHEFRSFVAKQKRILRNGDKTNIKIPSVRIVLPPHLAKA